MTRTTARARLLLALLASGLLAAGGAAAQAGAPTSIAYRVEQLPEDAVEGGLARLVLVAQGLSAAGVEIAARLDGGLALESSSSRPRVGAAGARELEIVLELRVLAAGRRQVLGIDIRGKEGSLRVPALSFAARGKGGSRDEPPAWRWSAPSYVTRYEAFEIRIEKADGSPAPAEASASFPPPPGSSLEPAGPLAWTAVALEEGELRLPEVRILAGMRDLGAAAPSALEARPLPAYLASSRAIGRFQLELLAPPAATLEAGRACRFVLRLSGRGNQPLVLLPEPRISVEGRDLPSESIRLERREGSKPAGEAFDGSCSLEISFTPAETGLLRLSFPPFAVLDPDSGRRDLSVPVFEAPVAPAPGGSGAALVAGGLSGQTAPASPGLFDPYLPALAARLAAREPSLSGLPELLRETREGAGAAARAKARSSALALFAKTAQDSAGPGGQTRLEYGGGDPEAAFLEAGLLWESGDRGRSLAILCGLARRGSGRLEAADGSREALASVASRLAAACSGELGAGPPLLDDLPRPRLFLGLALPALLLALVLFLVSFRSSRRPIQRAAAVLALAATLAAGGLGFASFLERRQARALLWTDRLLPVPSARAEASLPLAPGTTARVRGGSSGYVGVQLADGVSGWVRSGDLYFY